MVGILRGFYFEDSEIVKLKIRFVFNSKKLYFVEIIKNYQKSIENGNH
jgi:hypothetical protein